MPAASAATLYNSAVGIVWHDRRILVVQRRADVPLGGLWEYPGGKLEPGETPEAAFRRELREETGLRVGPCTRLPPLRHDYPHLRVRLHPFVATASSPVVRLCGPAAFRWVHPADLARLPLLPGSQLLARYAVLTAR